MHTCILIDDNRRSAPIDNRNNNFQNNREKMSNCQVITRLSLNDLENYCGITRRDKEPLPVYFDIVLFWGLVLTFSQERDPNFVTSQKAHRRKTTKTVLTFNKWSARRERGHPK